MSTVESPTITGFWIKNYKGLKQIAVGSSFSKSIVAIDMDLSPYDLTRLTTFIGPSGVGKSTILDAFGFLNDCLKEGLSAALDKRGGFDAIYHNGGTGPISIGCAFQACSIPMPLTYAVSIEKRGEAPFIDTEILVYRDNTEATGSKLVLLFQNGDKNIRHIAPLQGVPLIELDRIKRIDNRKLGLAALGLFEEVPDVPQLKNSLEGFHLAYYTPDSAQGLSPMSFKQDRGMRLFTEFKRMEEKFPYELNSILKVIASRMPTMEDISYVKSESGRIHLVFKKKGVEKPFFAQQMSESSLRFFVHMLLLEDPVPIPFIGIEEPDSGMDDFHIRAFANAVRNHVNMHGASQFFITTHHPSLADYMDPQDVWIIHENNDGETAVQRAYDELVYKEVDINSIGPGWYTEWLFRKSFY